MMKDRTECARSAVMLDGEISNYLDILRGVAQGFALSPYLFKACTNDMIVAIEAVRQGVRVGKIRCRDSCLRMISWECQEHPKDHRNK